MNVESPIFDQVRGQQEESDIHWRITLEFGLFALLLAAIFLTRLINLNYNTLFLDEAINILVGQDALAGSFERGAVSFHFGSYLYPVVSATVNQLGGVLGIRIASALTTTLAVVFVYLTTRALFGRNAALFAMLIFGFAGASINLGQLAVYDSLCIPFLALSLYCLVTAVEFPGEEKGYLVAASLFLILAVLSKYIGLIYMPALFLTAVALYIGRGQRVGHAVYSLALYFMLPALSVLGTYGLYYSDELREVATQQGFSPAGRLLITQVIWQEIGVGVLLALVGLFFLWQKIKRGEVEGLDLFRFEYWPGRNAQSRLMAGAVALFLALLVLSWLAAPLYHWLGQNDRSLWKNSIYSLIFLAPLAGYAIANLLAYSRRDTLTRMGSLALLIMAMILFVDRSLNSNWAFQKSWTDAHTTVNYLRQAGLSESDRVLAEAMDVYAYYLRFDTAADPVWHNVWYMEYEGLVGQEAVTAAVADQFFDFIILEDYYAPGIRQQLDPLLADAGYVIGFQENQQMRSGETVLVQVFILSD